MSDNITGFGSGVDEISLGLNLNTNIGNSINDFNTVDQILQQMVKDQEAFNGIQNDSFDKVKAMAQEIRNSSEQAQQLVSIFKTLRGEQEGNVQSAKQLASTYQQLNNELQKAQQNQTRLGITSPGASVPGSMPPTGGPGPIPGVPTTQTGIGGGGGGIKPPNTSPTAGFPNEPDDFFGREEVKSGAKGRGGKGGGGIDPSSFPGDMDLDNIDFESGDAFGTGRGGGMARRTSANQEKYKQLSDLAWTIFPNQGYYRNMRRVRWLTRNEGGAINKFVKSAPGRKLGMALNRLGGGQRLMTNEGYQLFPFAQDEDGNYVDTNNKRVGEQYEETPSTLYGLQNAAGQYLKQGGEGIEGRPTWSWNGEGEMPPMPNETPKPFNPWERPNLTPTGEGAAKIAGGMFAARAIKAKGGDFFREGQLYTGITGGTGIRGALGYDVGAQLTSWFGLNPLESYGQAKQITMQNLALGYRGNLLNQANAFGNQALQKYGVDPQTSMQLFGQMVMQAGASLQDLNASLATLAHTASTTDTSFSQLQQNVIQYSQIGGSIGLTGSQNALFATSAAQFAAGQPALGATGANPADILDSMVGQALVAQQMGTSYLGLPQAASQQGAGPLLNSEIKVNESLVNRIGLNKGNYTNSKALHDSYFKFQLLMNAMGRKKEANMQFGAYAKYIGDMFSGKQTKELHKTLNSRFSQDLGQKAGESPSQAIADSIALPNGELFGKSSVSYEMQAIESRNKWQNIGVDINGKFTGLSSIDTMPTSEREALLARISTGDTPLSHINKYGKLIKGNYASGTMLDLQGKSKEQFAEFGQTPNETAMHKVEHGAMTIELGRNALKYFELMDNPSNFNRHYNKWARSRGLPGTDIGNTPAGNNSTTG